jgi:hypothetical protein|tara:strand:- start:184 stop:336 length:153 start_codon:yes stop_codon:yes gene_type:complete
MSLDRWLMFSLKVLMVALVIELLIIIFIAWSGDVEEEYNHYMPNPAKRVQ